MTHALAIAARDLRARSNVFLLAAIVAAGPFLAALLRHSADPRSIIAVGGMILSAALTLGVAIAVGMTMVTSDLADRRMSFYFAKPVSAPAIWFGKLAAALLTVAMTFAIVFTPAYIATQSAWHSVIALPPVGVFKWMFAGAVALVLVSHALGTILRSHSPLAALDVLLAAAATFVLAWLVTPLLTHSALQLSKTIAFVVACAVPLIIAVAGAWQLARGRTDIRASHRAFSYALWAGMAIVIALAGGFVGYVVSASPRDLTTFSAMASPRGNFVAIGGTARHRGDYVAAFLVNATDGTWARSGSRRIVQFTRDGRAAITSSLLFDGARMVPRIDFGLLWLDGSGRMSDTGIVTTAEEPIALVASDDLRRIAAVRAHILSIYDVTTHQLLGSARIATGDDMRLFFVTPDVVRIYASVARWRNVLQKVPADLWIFEFDVRTKQLRQTGQATSASFLMPGCVSADGSILVVKTDDEMRILDGRTGALRVAIPTSKAASRATILSDNRVAFLDFKVGQQPLLRIVNGGVVRDIPIRHATGGFAREIVPGRTLLLITHDSAGDPRRATLSVVDLESGAVTNAQQDAAVVTQAWSSDPRPPVQGSETVLMDAHGALWRWNPLTGAKTKVL